MKEDRAFRALKKSLYEAVGKEIERVVEHYAVKSGRLGDHIYAKQERLLASVTEEEARNLFRKLMERSISANAIYLWAMKQAGGPPERRSSEDAARKAENLARLLESKGDVDGAESQRERARRIRHEVRSKAGG